MRFIDIILFVMLISFVANIVLVAEIIPLGNRNESLLIGDVDQQVDDDGRFTNTSSIEYKLIHHEDNLQSGTEPTGDNEDSTYLQTRLLLSGITDFVNIFFNSMIRVDHTYDDLTNTFFRDGYSKTRLYATQSSCTSATPTNTYYWYQGACYEKGKSFASKIKWFIVLPIWLFYVIFIIQVLTGRDINQMT